MVDGNSIVNNRAPVLVSWVAVNNDPYERERVTGQYRLVQDRPVPGPTWIAQAQRADAAEVVYRQQIVQLCEG